MMNASCTNESKRPSKGSKLEGVSHSKSVCAATGVEASMIPIVVVSGSVATLGVMACIF